MDQTVTVKNLKRLFDEDQKKGGSLEQKFFPDAFALKRKIAFIKRYYKFLRSRLKKALITEENFLARHSRLRMALDARRGKYDVVITDLLSSIAELINKKDFRLAVHALPELVNGKQVYSVGSTIESILAARHLQKILKELYGIRLAGRDLIVNQIKSLVFDGFPKYVIKADISSFYESVDHKLLLEQLHGSTKLSVLVKRLITRAVKDYVSLSGSEKGLPRGIGISAYLAEIYLAKVDQDLRRSSDLVYYSRYVDDMFLVYAPRRAECTVSYLSELKGILGRKGLVVNSKTDEISFLTEQKGSFEYLGYAFKVDGASKKVMLSHKKCEKYRARVKKSFDEYKAKQAWMRDKSSKDLIARIGFLTSNTRLFNRKSNAFIGVYFGNKFINDTKQLVGLDHFLKHQIGMLDDERLKRRLSRYSFELGFNNKIFREFDPKTLSEMSRGWLHG
ncbi:MULTISPECIES: antiviral reverse transcriptase Drt3a [unclassified Pseudomonas]|uniref:antiviral reverse transcriptase Drt3a n=1 Tax=unclassified Pseudomonas TaxID=196821 RepID=UPI0025EE2807|nr:MULTISPECIES: antiviral reverse transcriptase Drt3a [unclassified Pseudomonas]